MNQLKFYIVLLLITCSVFVPGCSNDQRIFSEKKQVGPWSDEMVVTFRDIRYPAGSQLLLRITHSEVYAYENIYLQLIAHSQSDTLKNDVFSIPLLDDKGVWAGDQQGKSIILEFSLDNKFDYQQKSFDLDIKQYSRELILPGIYSIEVVVKKAS